MKDKELEEINLAVEADEVRPAPTKPTGRQEPETYESDGRLDPFTDRQPY